MCLYVWLCVSVCECTQVSFRCVFKSTVNSSAPVNAGPAPRPPQETVQCQEDRIQCQTQRHAWMSSSSSSSMLHREK